MEIILPPAWRASPNLVFERFTWTPPKFVPLKWILRRNWGKVLSPHDVTWGGSLASEQRAFKSLWQRFVKLSYNYDSHIWLGHSTRVAFFFIIFFNYFFHALSLTHDLSLTSISIAWEHVQDAARTLILDWKGIVFGVLDMLQVRYIVA